jgi:hypothetical protein
MLGLTPFGLRDLQSHVAIAEVLFDFEEAIA